jgi:hypothetical protein
MESSVKMENWQLFTHPSFKLHFQYPAMTPQGHIVEKAEEQHNDHIRIHLASQDSPELYFEFACIAG